MNNKKLINIAIKAALLASKKLLQAYNEEIIINSSKEKDIKLQVDIESEKIILNILQKETNIPILSEEKGFLKYGDNSYSRWIVDPLDGSLNFSRNIPINCISIGLWNNSKPIFGVIYNFLNDDIYIGEVGVGATLNGNNITVSSIETLTKSILCTGFPVYSDFDTTSLTKFLTQIQVFKKVRLLGSAALSLCLVAKGSIEAYQENNIAIWDVAAGIPLVIAAGGKVDFSFGNKENLLNVFASNGLIG